MIKKVLPSILGIISLLLTFIISYINSISFLEILFRIWFIVPSFYIAGLVLSKILVQSFNDYKNTINSSMNRLNKDGIDKKENDTEFKAIDFSKLENKQNTI